MNTMHNFGKINNAFVKLLSEAFTKKDSAKKLSAQKYLAMIKESKILNTQFNVYKNLEDKHDTDDFRVSEYIKENISLMNKYNLKDIRKANEKLNTFALTVEGLDLDGETSELHTNIDKLMMTRKTHKTIDTIVESLSQVATHIKGNVINEEVKSVPEPVLNLAIKKYNEKYSDLSEDEAKVLKSIIDGANQEDAFKACITECVDLVNNHLVDSDIETKGKLLGVKDKLLRMTYIEESFIDDIKSVIELKSGLV